MWHLKVRKNSLCNRLNERVNLSRVNLSHRFSLESERTLRRVETPISTKLREALQMIIHFTCGKAYRHV